MRRGVMWGGPVLLLGIRLYEPPAIPAGALLDEAGDPLLDEAGDTLLEE